MKAAISSAVFANRLIPGIAGVDEAGRGPLAGPVVAAAVVLAPGQHIEGVRDSKQLTARRRALLAGVIEREAVAVSLGRAEAAEIDELNILQATLLAMVRALQGLEALPELLQVDGNQLPPLGGYAGEARAIVGGDRLCLAVAAASILAKVSRDSEMLILDERYPGYGFAAHKGYPTALHRAALVRLGPCPEHRRSFAPVRSAMQVTPGARK